MTPKHPSDPAIQHVALSRGVVGLTDEGAGTAVLAVHGLPGTHRDFRWLATELEQHCRFIRVDQPGFGETALRTASNPTAQARAAFFLELLDALSLPKVVLLAHSVGGHTALELAARHPERVSGVVLLASVGLRPHQLLRRWSPQPAAFAMRIPLAPRLLRGRIRKAFRAAGFPSSTPDHSLYHTVRSAGALDFRRANDNVARLTAPTFIAWAVDDKLVEPAIGEELGARCPAGPRIAFEEGGHNIQKTHAVELSEAIVEFLKSLQ